MITHRNAVNSDLAFICQLPRNEAELFNIFPSATYPLTLKQLSRVLEERVSSTVFLEGDTILGFADLYGVAKGDSGGIGNVIVSHDHRGKGVGRHIIGTMIEFCKSMHSLKRIRIACMSDNFPGLFLYTSMGFKPFKIDSLLNPFGERVPRIHLQMSLR